MDDLEMLTTLLAKPEPSDDVVDRGRDQLRQAMDRPTRQLRPGWRAGTVGLTTAATITAVVVAAIGGTAHPATPGHAGTARQSTAPTQEAGQRILLAAATAAQRQRPGDYWHFKIMLKPTGASAHPSTRPGYTTIVDSYETWTARDGRYWTAPPGCAAGTVVFEGPGLAGFLLGNRYLTYQQTRQMPTAPATLEAWFARYDPSHRDTDSFVADALVALQYQVPAPPQVRAAAFRALATFPGVTSLGPVKGGEGLLISFPGEPGVEPLTLVFDPATSLLRSETNAKATTTVETAGWTNRLPKVVPLPLKTACSG